MRFLTLYDLLLSLKMDKASVFLENTLPLLCDLHHAQPPDTPFRDDCVVFVLFL